MFRVVRLILVIVVGVGSTCLAQNREQYPDKQEISADVLAALRLAASDFEGVVEQARDAGSRRELRDYRVVLRRGDGVVEIVFIGKIDRDVGGGAQYFIKAPYLMIDRRVLSR